MRSPLVHQVSIPLLSQSSNSGEFPTGRCITTTQTLRNRPYTSLLTLQRLPRSLEPTDPQSLSFNLYKSAVCADLSTYNVGDFVLVAGRAGDHNSTPAAAQVLEIIQIISPALSHENLASGILVEAFDTSETSAKYGVPILKSPRPMMIRPQVSSYLNHPKLIYINMFSGHPMYG